jgi:two-component system, cell cycle sensor histidine kinase and response regulator CckA
MITSSQIHQARILIVDDQPANVALLEQMLAGAGYTSVSSTRNSHEVCELHRLNRYSLILLDLQMPGLDGFQVMECLKEIETEGYLPVLVITAQPGHKLRALNAGARDFVSKPFDLPEVLMRVYNMLEIRLLQMEMKRTSELAIRTSELKYRRVFEAAKDGILILDALTGRIQDANPFLMELLGLTHGDFTGQTIADLQFFPGLESAQNMLEHLQTDHYIRYDNQALITKDGRKLTVELVSNLYTVGDHQVIQCNIRDLTQRKQGEAQILQLNTELQQRLDESQQLQAQFIESQKMEVVGQLASGVAHDFNNILGIIMFSADLIAMELPVESELLQYTDEIRLASERAVGLTRQLLVFSRKQTVNPVVLDLNDVVKSLDRMLRRLIDENIEMKVTCGKNAGRVKADSGYLGQVLMNLIVNARDAMPNGGKLTIVTSKITLHETDKSSGIPAGDYMMLSVTDTGTGMTDEVKGRLFEAFFTTKPLGKGTGLGLATCHTIVQQSQGFITVQSQLGQGTTFEVYFPCVEDQATVAVTLAAGPMPRGNETLLLVEDEPSVRHLARGVLEAQGYQVLTATNGQDGLEVVQEHQGAPISLVVTDVIMPLMGGRAMTESLKTSLPELKVLFTSGYTDETIARHGVLEAGVKFLPKPYSPATLARKVRELLDHRD